jgi:hypothetical protein
MPPPRVRRPREARRTRSRRGRAAPLPTRRDLYLLQRRELARPRRRPLPGGRRALPRVLPRCLPHTANPPVTLGSQSVEQNRASGNRNGRTSTVQLKLAVSANVTASAKTDLKTRLYITSYNQGNL